MKITGFRCLLMTFSASLGFCSCTPSVTVSVYNPSTTLRLGQVVEIDASSITDKVGKDFIVTDAAGLPVISQITYDGKILVEGDFTGGETRKYFFRKSDGKKRAVADTVCVGMIRHDKQDDFAWENDRGGYRLYGPSYREKGGNVSGYDIWTKSVGYPVLEARYDDHGFIKASYHKDHGSGMDVYTVGRTLGAGMNALVTDGEIAYPCAYEKCDILESGPLRMTARITCYPETVGGDKDVVETRIITLDKGAWLNKTEVKYDGLSGEYPLVNGIVIHKQNPRGFIVDSRGDYLAYADLTDNPDKGNGVIYIGIVNHERPDSVGYTPLAAPLGDATGHIMSHSVYKPGETYTYYWGSGWSKGGVRGMKAWTEYLADFHEGLAHPLEVTVK